jgi:hypothetical protein
MTTRALDNALLFPTDVPAAGEGLGWSAAFKMLWTAFAPLNSPGLTGNPTAPTPPHGDSDTSIATTAFVQDAVTTSVGGVASFNARVGAVVLTALDVTSVVPSSNAPPVMDGVAAAGAATSWARGDHVHPSDTSRLALAGGTMVGALVLAADPSAAMQPVTLQYLQANSLNAGSSIDCGTY